MAALLPVTFGDDNAMDHPVEGWASSWREHVATSTADCQTDALEQANQRTQHPKRNDMEVQTEDVAAIGATPMLRSGFAKLRELDAFLEQCVPLLEDQLHRNLNTRAFDSHEVAWDEQHDQVSCLHSLRHQGALANLSPEACTCVVWNAPGTVVAAAYGPLDQNDWPRRSSMLCTWSVFRRNLDPSKADVAIELPDCLTCLAFHPEDPALLAGGAFNGDVLLWRIGEKGDPLIGKSVLNNYTHHEPVQQLQWTKDPTRGGAGGRGYVLASVASDGKLLLWSEASFRDTKTPMQGFLLSSALFEAQDKDGDGQITREEVMAAQHAAMTADLEGGTALSFSAEDPTSFVVGFEAGQLYKGSLLANEIRSSDQIRREVGELPWAASAAALLTRVPQDKYHRLKQKIEKDAVLARAREVLPSHVFAAAPPPREVFASPLTFRYQRHAGPAYATKFSPFHRNVFLSASTDTSVRLYNQLQPQPFHVTEPSSSPLLAAAWSPARPLVFAACAAQGDLYLYDLKRSKGKPEVTLKVTSNKSAVTACAFNPKSPELLATADAQGFVKIWRLSTFLSEPAPRELEALDSMASSGRAVKGADGAEDDDDGAGGEDKPDGLNADS